MFADATDVYLGQAAHCSGTGAATDTNGCTAQSLPLGTPVDITGADHPGTLVYNSWLTMQSRGEADPDACAFNDLALVRIDPADVAKVNPSIPFWGGPTGIDGDGTVASDKVLSYGHSELRGGTAALSPKEGASLGDDGNGWSHTVYTATPGIPATPAARSSTAPGRRWASWRRSRSRRSREATPSATSATSSPTSARTRASRSRCRTGPSRSADRCCRPDPFRSG